MNKPSQSILTVLVMPLIPTLALFGAAENPRGDGLQPAIDPSAGPRLIAASKELRQAVEKGKPVTGQVPVYYLSNWSRDPLTAGQKQQIIDAARRVERWRDIWCITVSSNRKGR